MKSKLAISVPTLDRYKRLEWIVENIHKTTNELDYNIYFIAEDNDTETIKEVNRIKKEYGSVNLIKSTGRNINAAVNEMYRQTKEELIYLSCDDLEFTPGWLTPCLNVMEENPKIMIVGTYDGYTSGEANSGYLIKREYVDNHSCVVDCPKTIYNEVYEHFYADTELYYTGKTRGVYQFCKASVVYHQHYSLANKYQRDATAEHNELPAEKDRQEYNKRCHLFRAPQHL